MPNIVLAALNARYAHTAFGSRCLLAGLGDLRADAVLLEGTLEDRPVAFAERILRERPRVVGLSVYIWNAREMLDVVRVLKKVAPEVVVVVGGPEVSYEIDAQPICALADHVVRREGELVFAEICRAVLSPSPLAQKLEHVIDGGAPDIEALAMPYGEYTDDDLAGRTVYLEASRGCPFRCAFCLSALDKTVRPFPRGAFLRELETLYARGLRRFKFVDRTFNLDIDHAREILSFFQARISDDLFLHFEMVPDRLPAALVDELAKFPPGTVQLEVGFQTFTPEVMRNIDRRTDLDRAVANLKTLRARTGVHIHADLIAGLPGETWSDFATGFDALFAAGPHEIQLGVLKRLRGFPLADKPEAAGLVFQDAPPYEVLCTDTLSFDELMRLRRVSRFWDLVFNHGRFPATCALLVETWSSVFAGLAEMSARFFEVSGAAHGISLMRLAELLFDHMLELGVDREAASAVIGADYCEGDRRRPPPFLTAGGVSRRARRAQRGLPDRQRRHSTSTKPAEQDQ